jgi:hypothetical protein
MSQMDLYSRRRDFFLQPNQNLKGGIVAGLLIGALTVVAGTLVASPQRVWGAVLMNVFFFFSIGLGGIVFSGVQDVVGAVWARPIKRIHESFAAFLPIGAGILAVFLIAIFFDVLHARKVYVWMVNPDMLDHFYGKNVWLEPRFMAVRNLIALGVIVFLSSWQLRVTVKRDMVFMDGQRDAAESESILARDRLRYWCAPVLLCYASAYSLLAFDLVMSLSPLWFSTLWAGWMFAVMMQTLMATILVFLFALRDSNIGQVYQRAQFHDVGKLMHGFTVFFAYLTYAHILTFWYGNMPEETEFLIERLKGPWLWIVLISPIFSFLIPLYTLIFKAAKWTSVVTLTLCAMILVSQWFIYGLIFLPAITGSSWATPWVDFGVLALTVSLFLGSISWFGKRYPMVGVGDALLPEALHGGHH